MTLKLHSYFNSSTSYRVRIALALKGVAYGTIPVDIRTGAQQGLIPALAGSAAVPVAEFDDGTSLGQSLAIIDYLDALHPEPRLVPADPLLRARVLELAYLIACDIHPVNNLRILRRLTSEFGVSQEERDAWYAHWLAEGLAGVELLLERHGSGPWCFGEGPTLADCCLVPQVFNAIRTGNDTTPYPRTMAVYAHAIAQPAMVAAMPVNQPDFQ